MLILIYFYSLRTKITLYLNAIQSLFIQNTKSTGRISNRKTCKCIYSYSDNKEGTSVSRTVMKRHSKQRAEKQYYQEIKNKN